MHQKLIKKSKSKIEKSVAERVKLRRQKLNVIARKKKKRKEKINNTIFNYYFDYSNSEFMFRRLRDSIIEKIKVW